MRSECDIHPSRNFAAVRAVAYVTSALLPIEIVIIDLDGDGWAKWLLAHGFSIAAEIPYMHRST